MKVWIVILIALAAISCGSEDIDPPTARAETTRLIEQGRIVGTVAENGAHVWRGIPFAASTAGENRWRAPQPPAPWDGDLETLIYAERCAQITTSYDAEEGFEPGIVVGSEDCLTVNVFAPSDAQDKTLPVMFWIHGGGNVWGKASDYDGSRLAENENVIVVTVQYRLGPLGWFAHEALRESAIDPQDGVASFAILDLVASLEWVRDNISAFGGDPENVTIFGESAGGHNVAALLASPLSKGLFHRAVVQSGLFGSVSLAEAEGAKSGRANPSNEIAEKLNAGTAEALRALPLDVLLPAYVGEGGGLMDLPRMIEDGVALPDKSLLDALGDPDLLHQVPVIVGVNRDEMKLFYFRDERLTKKVLGFFVTPRDREFYDAISHYVSRSWRVHGLDDPASAMRSAGHEEVYAYRFDWDDSGRFLIMDFKVLLGAAHGFEIPFVFNHFEGFGLGNDIIFSKRTAADREMLSRTMGRYWASFARDGAPISEGAPAWPSYGPQARVLRLDTDNDGGIENIKGADSIDAIAKDLIEDSRLDQEQRCIIVEEIAKRMWLYDQPTYDTLLSVVGCPSAAE